MFSRPVKGQNRGEASIHSHKNGSENASQKRHIDTELLPGKGFHLEPGHSSFQSEALTFSSVQVSLFYGSKPLETRVLGEIEI